MLTFDDGPTGLLPKILSILKEEKVQALFFWQTQSLDNWGSQWRQVLEQGHEIGTHCQTHPKLPDLSYEEQFREIQGSKERLEALTGRPVTRFRPPYGLYNEDTITIAQSLGLEVVLWQVASWDWKHETDEHRIAENVVNHISPGDIVLLHELPQTVKVLQELITALRHKGLQLAKPHSPIDWD